MGEVLRAVRAWLFADVWQRWAVVCRIGFGLTFLGAFVSLLPDVDRLFGPDGIGGARTRVALSELASPAQSAVPLLARADEPALVWALYCAAVVAAAAFTVGYRTRTFGIVLIVLHALFVARAPFAYWGWARMLPVYTAYVLFADPGRAASVDAWLRRRRGQGGGEELAPAWPKRLLQVHVCTMYAVAGLSRLDQPAWLAGVTMYDALTNLLFARADVDWTPHQGVLRVLAWFAFVLEPLAPAFLWLRSLGPPWALALMAMHVVLELTTTVGWWNFMMIAALVVFLPRRWLEPLLGAEPSGYAPVSRS